MKYKEFREYLTLNKIYLKEYEESIIADSHIKISKIEEHRIEFLINAFEYLYECDLIKKAVELAETPLSKRREEKKYYIKHKFINNYSTRNYINVVATGYLILSGRMSEDQVFKTKFTKAEIEELKVEFDTDLNDFEFIEVED